MAGGKRGERGGFERVLSLSLRGSARHPEKNLPESHASDPQATTESEPGPAAHHAEMALPLMSGCQLSQGMHARIHGSMHACVDHRRDPSIKRVSSDESTRRLAAESMANRSNRDGQRTRVPCSCKPNSAESTI